MIVITGATGNVGRPLVDALAGQTVTAVSRADGVDLTHPETLKPALDGADALFLLTAGSFLANGRMTDVIEVVKSAGVPKVVLLSSQGVATGRHPSVHEDAVTGSGLDWTILRGSNFASNAFQWAEPVRTQRILAAPFGDVAVPVVDPADIAAVAAVALTRPGHTGQVYSLTGPAALTPRQQAQAIEDALGDPVQYVELTRAEARAGMLAFMPEPVVDTTLDILGTPTPEEQQVSDDIETVLGRPAGTFADWVSRNLPAFR
ncbi:NAD(P)H-binding protein [Kribbella sp. NPDC026611]|uniref:NAD(P)H-binding protein n=1 Tax=Kribbella sp. NPDC026611 TaxID=3154911 RepID=UPI0033D1CCD2